MTKTTWVISGCLSVVVVSVCGLTVAFIAALMYRGALPSPSSLATLPAQALQVAETKADAELYDSAIVPYLPIKPEDSAQMQEAMKGLRDDLASKIHYDRLVGYSHPANDAWCVKLTYTVINSLNQAQRQEAISVSPQFFVVLVIQDTHGWTGLAVQKEANDASRRCNLQ
jgi:hypothetical protein